MSINIGQWVFDGPYPNANHLAPRSGVYVILGRNLPWQQWTVIDVGETGDLRQRISAHDRADQWRRQNYVELSVASLHCDERNRMTVEAHLRSAYNPPCGDR